MIFGIKLRDYSILVRGAGRPTRGDCVDISAGLPLEAGTVINIEAPVSELNNAALQLEQSYVLTAAGGQPLNNRDLSHSNLGQG